MCEKCEEFDAYTPTKFDYDVEGWCTVKLLKDGKPVACLETLTDAEKLEALRYLIAQMEQKIDYGKERAYGEDL